MKLSFLALTGLMLWANCAGGSKIKLNAPADPAGSLVLSAFQFEEALENAKNRVILTNQPISNVDINSKIKVRIDRFALMEALGNPVIGDDQNMDESQSDFVKQRNIFLGILDSIDQFLDLTEKERQLYEASHDLQGQRIEGDAFERFEIINSRIDRIGLGIYEAVEKYVLKSQAEDLSLIRETKKLDSNEDAVYFFLDEKAGGSIFDPAFSGFINAEITALDQQIREEKENILSTASSYQLNLTAQLLSPKGPGAFYHLPGYDSLKAGIPTFVNRLSFNLDQKEKQNLESAVNFSKSVSNTLNQINAKNTNLKEILGREMNTLKNDIDKLLDQLDVKNLENVLVTKNEEVIRQLTAETELKNSLQTINSQAQNLIQSIEVLKEAGHIADKEPGEVLMDFSQGALANQKQNIDHIATSLKELPQLLESVQENTLLDSPFRSEVETVHRSVKEAAGLFLKIKSGSEILGSMYGKVGGMINISKGDNFNASTIQVPLDQIKDTEFHIFRQAREENDLVEFTAIVKDRKGEAVGEGKKIFRLKKFGLNANISGNVIFVRETSKKTDSTDKAVNFTAAPSVSYTFNHLSRTNKVWNTFDPGIGISTAVLNFKGSGLEFGVGGVVTLFQDILQGGYGYNLQTETGYFFIGIGFSGMIGAAQQQGGQGALLK